jgi:cephalosporin hydroxylase
MGEGSLRVIASALSTVPWTGRESIVEIGVYIGGTTVFMAKVMAAIGKQAPLICIDPFEKADHEKLNAIGDRGLFDGALKSNGVEATVIPLPSRMAIKQVIGPIGFLLIDGSHQYANVVDDLNLYARKVVPLGMVFADDYCPVNYPGVFRALNEFIPAHPEFEIVARDSYILMRRSES